jgi:hypothetical protein
LDAARESESASEAISAAADDVPSCNDGELVNDDDIVPACASDADDEQVESQSDDHGLADEPWNSKGIKDKDVAPKAARAKCEVCKERIMPGELRFDYRYKISDTLGDQKRIHARCCNRLPAETRLRDIAQLKRWLRDGDLAHDVAAAVESALADLHAAV